MRTCKVWKLARLSNVEVEASSLGSLKSRPRSLTAWGGFSSAVASLRKFPRLGDYLETVELVIVNVHRFDQNHDLLRFRDL